MLNTISHSPTYPLQVASFVNRQKPKDSLFTIINGKEKQQILKFKKLQPANVLAWNITKAMTLLSKLLPTNFLFIR